MYDFIVNPNARSGLGGRIWKELEQLLKEQSIGYILLNTRDMQAGLRKRLPQMGKNTPLWYLAVTVR